MKTFLLIIFLTLFNIITSILFSPIGWIILIFIIIKDYIKIKKEIN